jgi:cytidylate kinase
MTIITISKMAGTYADEIAKKTAKHLNFDFRDKEIADALSEYGFQQQDKDLFNEKGLSFWEFVSQSKSRFQYHVKTVVSEFAQEGNVVIYGWGANVLLRGIPGVLRTRIIAPFEIRLKRIMKQQNCDEKSAERIIRKLDKDSKGFVRSFFQADREEKDLYDIMLNTETLSVDTGVELILAAHSAKEFKVRSSETAEKLADLALTLKVQATLAETPGSETINFILSQGVVELSGFAISAEIRDECAIGVSNITGIKEVNNQIRVVS